MGTLRSIRVVAVLLLVLGTAMLPAQSVQAASPPPSPDILHEVLAGDCLYLIAGYYYGDTRLWERIWKANPHLVRNPHVLVLGTFLLIPDAGTPAEPYPDFTARAIGCGPAGAARASAEKTEKPAEAAPAKPSAPSKAR
jgi:hypothetical protein